MSTQRVERIEVRAFKAFKHLNFELDGRHLLAVIQREGTV